MNSTLENLDGSIYDTLYVARVSRDGTAAGVPVCDVPIDIYDAAQSRSMVVSASGSRAAESEQQGAAPSR